VYSINFAWFSVSGLAFDKVNKAPAIGRAVPVIGIWRGDQLKRKSIGLVEFPGLPHCRHFLRRGHGLTSASTAFTSFCNATSVGPGLGAGLAGLKVVI
jgi:hypothetical protein